MNFVRESTAGNEDLLYHNEYKELFNKTEYVYEKAGIYILGSPPFSNFDVGYPQINKTDLEFDFTTITFSIPGKKTKHACS